MPIADKSVNGTTRQETRQEARRGPYSGATAAPVQRTVAGREAPFGMFHVDMPNRPSLALDAIEAIRPYVDLWLFGYLADAAFALGRQEDSL